MVNAIEILIQTYKQSSQDDHLAVFSRSWLAMARLGRKPLRPSLVSKTMQLAIQTS